MSDLIKVQNHSLMSFNEMKEAATIVAESKLFPSWSTPAQVLTLMMLCQAENVPAIMAVNRYNNIQGKICKNPQAMLSDFIKAGGRAKWVISDNEVAELELTTPAGDKHIETFTIEDAKRAGLAHKDNWKKYAKSMLRARTISFAMRAVYPEATTLLYTPEEIESIEPATKTRKKKEKIATPIKVVVEEAIKKVEIVEPVAATKDLTQFDQKKLIGYLQSINWIEEKLSELTEEQNGYINKNFKAFSDRVTKFEVK